MPAFPFPNDRYPLIIDGGLSNVLEEQGCDLQHPLWTARLLDNNPEAIIQAHLDYIEAGAQCITTASYQASIPGFMKLGYSRDAAQKLLVKSVRLAELAIEKALDAGTLDRKPLIAASVGPYGAYLADGSEYRGNYGLTNDVLREFHRERIKVLDQTQTDLLACETIPSFQEGSILSDILMEVSTPAWVSFSCKDEQHLNDGSAIKDSVSIFKDHPKVFAVGVNCTAPRYISGVIKCIKGAAIGKKILIYPNSGEAYHAESKTWLGLSQPHSFGAMAKEWLALGADMIGGCCRIGPVQIREMRRVVNRIDHA